MEVKAQLLSEKEMANILGVSMGTMRNYRKKRYLPYYTFGKTIRYNKDEVLKCTKCAKGKDCS